MKRGDIVMIYEDPITKKKPEGKAKLLERLDEWDEGSFNKEYWKVKFVSDNFIAAQWVS